MDYLWDKKAAYSQNRSVGFDFLSLSKTNRGTSM